MTEENKSLDKTNSKKEYKVALKNIAQIVYLCQTLSFVFGLTFIAGVIINYVKKDEAKDTWLEPHFTWQIRTFWFGLLWAVIGFILSIVIIGFLVIAADIIWILYRVIRGWLALLEGKSPAAPIESSKGESKNE